MDLPNLLHIGLDFELPAADAACELARSAAGVLSAISAANPTVVDQTDRLKFCMAFPFAPQQSAACPRDAPSTFPSPEPCHERGCCSWQRQ
jgi:hypothetical protein